MTSFSKVFVGLIVLALAGAAAAQNPNPSLIPWPKSVRLQMAVPLSFGKTAKIEAEQAELKPLAGVLAGEIGLATGVKLDQTGQPAIVLRIVKTMNGEEYHIRVAQKAVVEGGSYQAVALGTATLLQSMYASSKGVSIPRMEISDHPDRGYRGLLVDVARRYHSIATLQQCIELCRFYKIRYLQLHLTDDQSFTFPSTAFPALATKGSSYTLEELRGLVRFADVRGVTLVPELEVPGHAGAMVRAMPDLFLIKGTKPYEHGSTVNFANDAVLAALDKLVGEISDVFKSSPYFHIGGDEADYQYADQHPDFQAAFTKYGLKGAAQHQIYRHFVNEMNGIVKRHGKQTVVWEGFGREPDSPFPIDKDILVMAYESSYYLPTDLVADGYNIVNAAWTPLYVVNRHVWPPKKVYDWDLATLGRYSQLWSTVTWFKLPDLSHVAGSQVCSWEQPEYIEVSNLRRVVAAMGDKVWNISSKRKYDDFASRLSGADSVLDSLVHAVKMKVEGLAPRGEDDFDDAIFYGQAKVSLTGKAGLRLRYTLDGSPPTAGSSLYEKPLVLKDTTTVRAALFDNAGKRVGYETANSFYLEHVAQKSLATGKPVRVSGGTQGPQVGALAVDGNLDLGSSWWASPAPQWLEVDLGSVFKVGQIDVYPYWDGRRYYQYTVEVSTDRSKWTVVADKSANTTPASASGDRLKIAPTEARYVRVNMTKCSVNEGVHLVELHVWEAK